jgi:hypothetical protein
MTLRVVQGEFGDSFDSASQVGRDAKRLFEYAQQHTEGFTHVQAEAKFFWNTRYFFYVSRHVRLRQAKHETTLICTRNPDDRRGPWVYRLTGDWDQALEWSSNRLSDAESRIEVIRDVAATEMKAHDRRTVKGRKAKIIFKAMDRLIEDLTELLEDAV